MITAVTLCIQTKSTSAAYAVKCLKGEYALTCTTLMRTTLERSQTMQIFVLDDLHAQSQQLHKSFQVI